MHGPYSAKIMVLILKAPFLCFSNIENYDKVRNKIAQIILMTENNL